MGIKILSGGKGAGKTTYLRRLIAEAVAGGHTVGGIASPAVFEATERIGYNLLDLRQGTERALARVAAAQAVASAAESCGVYEFDADAIKEGNLAVVQAVRDRLDLVAIDEVGPLEFRGGGWTPALETVLDECGLDQELIITVRPSLADRLAERFPSPRWAEAVQVSPPWPDG